MVCTDRRNGRRKLLLHTFFAFRLIIKVWRATIENIVVELNMPLKFLCVFVGSKVGSQAEEIKVGYGREKNYICGVKTNSIK